MLQSLFVHPSPFNQGRKLLADNGLKQFLKVPFSETVHPEVVSTYVFVRLSLRRSSLGIKGNTFLRLLK